MYLTAIARALNLLSVGLFIGFISFVRDHHALHVRPDFAGDQLHQAVLHPQVEPGDCQHASLSHRDVGLVDTGIVVFPVRETKIRAKTRADLAGRARVVAVAG
jgi:hypothetical protein